MDDGEGPDPLNTPSTQPPPTSSSVLSSPPATVRQHSTSPTAPPKGSPNPSPPGTPGQRSPSPTAPPVGSPSPSPPVGKSNAQLAEELAAAYDGDSEAGSVFDEDETTTTGKLVANLDNQTLEHEKLSFWFGSQANLTKLLKLPKGGLKKLLISDPRIQEITSNYFRRISPVENPTRHESFPVLYGKLGGEGYKAYVDLLEADTQQFGEEEWRYALHAQMRTVLRERANGCLKTIRATDLALWALIYCITKVALKLNKDTSQRSAAEKRASEKEKAASEISNRALQDSVDKIAKGVKPAHTLPKPKTKPESRRSGTGKGRPPAAATQEVGQEGAGQPPKEARADTARSAVPLPSATLADGIEELDEEEIANAFVAEQLQAERKQLEKQNARVEKFHRTLAACTAAMKEDKKRQGKYRKLAKISVRCVQQFFDDFRHVDINEPYKAALTALGRPDAIPKHVADALEDPTTITAEQEQAGLNSEDMLQYQARREEEAQARINARSGNKEPVSLDLPLPTEEHRERAARWTSTLNSVAFQPSYLKRACRELGIHDLDFKMLPRQSADIRLRWWQVLAILYFYYQAEGISPAVFGSLTCDRIGLGKTIEAAGYLLHDMNTRDHRLRKMNRRMKRYLKRLEEKASAMAEARANAILTRILLTAPEDPPATRPDTPGVPSDVVPIEEVEATESDLDVYYSEDDNMDASISDEEADRSTDAKKKTKRPREDPRKKKAEVYQPYLFLTLSQIAEQTAGDLAEFSPHFRIVRLGAAKQNRRQVQRLSTLGTGARQYYCATGIKASGFYDPYDPDTGRTIFVASYLWFAREHGPRAYHKWLGGRMPVPGEWHRTTQSDWPGNLTGVFRAVILDEAGDGLRNHTTYWFSVFYLQCIRKVLMTGSPAPRGLVDFAPFIELLQRPGFLEQSRRPDTLRDYHPNNVNPYKLPDNHAAAIYRGSAFCYRKWVIEAEDIDEYERGVSCQKCLSLFTIRRDTQSACPPGSANTIARSFPPKHHYIIEKCFSPTVLRMYVRGIVPWEDRPMLLRKDARSPDDGGIPTPNGRYLRAMEWLAFFPPLCFLHKDIPVKKEHRDAAQNGTFRGDVNLLNRDRESFFYDKSPIHQDMPAPNREGARIRWLFKQIARKELLKKTRSRSFQKIDFDKMSNLELATFFLSFSPKMQAVLSVIQYHALLRDEKVIIWCQSPGNQKLAQEVLWLLHLPFLSMYKESTMQSRSEIQDSWNDPNDDCRILLLSVRVGGIGLNLQKDSHVAIAVDPFQSMDQQLQTEGRQHRSGQVVSCTFYQTTVQGTVDLKVIYENLQNALASTVALMDNPRKFHSEDDILPELATEYKKKWATGYFFSDPDVPNSPVVHFATRTGQDAILRVIQRLTLQYALENGPSDGEELDEEAKEVEAAATKEFTDNLLQNYRPYFLDPDDAIVQLSSQLRSQFIKWHGSSSANQVDLKSVIDDELTARAEKRAHEEELSSDDERVIQMAMKKAKSKKKRRAKDEGATVTRSSPTHSSDDDSSSDTEPSPVKPPLDIDFGHDNDQPPHLTDEEDIEGLDDLNQTDDEATVTTRRRKRRHASDSPPPPRSRSASEPKHDSDAAPATDMEITDMEITDMEITDVKRDRHLIMKLGPEARQNMLSSLGDMPEIPDAKEYARMTSHAKGKSTNALRKYFSQWGLGDYQPPSKSSHSAEDTTGTSRKPKKPKT